MTDPTPHLPRDGTIPSGSYLASNTHRESKEPYPKKILGVFQKTRGLVHYVGLRMI